MTTPLSDAEEGLLELEALLEKPRQGLHAPILAKAKMTCESLWQPRQWLTSRSKPRAPLRRTAYLDGLRGFAALLVYFTHHHAYAHEGLADQAILNNGFGFNNEYHFVTFPGIRVFFSGGHTAVAIFFAVSGYVLSVSPLNLLHEGERARLAESLGSALFRRWLRLYLPIIFTTLAWLTLWHVLNIQSGKFFADPPESTYLDELWKWYCDFKNFSFIFTGDPANVYNFHLWTIPLEFRGSIVVFTSAIAFCRFRTNIRLLCEACLVFYFIYIVDGYYCALFATGMLLRDLDMLAEKGQLPEQLQRLNPATKWPYYILMVVSLYLAGVPSDNLEISHLRKQPGWYLLSFLKPQAFYDYRWFYRTVAGVSAMVAIPRIPWLKGFFEGAFCQYLGRISYGLYLVHGPVMWSLGDRLYAATGRIRDNSPAVVPGWINMFPFPNWGLYGLELNYFIPHLILLPFTLWLAEVVTKLIDEPSVKFSQWLFKSLAGAEPGELKYGEANEKRGEKI